MCAKSLRGLALSIDRRDAVPAAGNREMLPQRNVATARVADSPQAAARSSDCVRCQATSGRMPRQTIPR
jgi:hypothetical protein